MRAGGTTCDVTASFSCGDSGSVQSGIFTDTVAGATVSGEGAGQSVTNSGDCMDNAGNAAPSASVSGINIDKTSPVISGSRDPLANANGWNNSDVTVSFTCDDAGSVQSGVATDTVAGATLSGEGAGQSVTNSGDCIDNAGNAASSASVSGINIDKTAPVISGSRDPLANANGWNNSDVTASFTCDDAGSVQSGIFTDTVAGATVGGEGPGQSVTNSGDCVDNAGNAASPATVGGMNIDKTAPVISGSRSPEANASGWNNLRRHGLLQLRRCRHRPVGYLYRHRGRGDCQRRRRRSVGHQQRRLRGQRRAMPPPSASVSGINIDETAPVISGSRDPLANVNGWNNT